MHDHRRAPPPEHDPLKPTGADMRHRGPSTTPITATSTPSAPKPGGPSKAGATRRTIAVSAALAALAATGIAAGIGPSFAAPGPSAVHFTSGALTAGISSVSPTGRVMIGTSVGGTMSATQSRFPNMK